MLIMYQLLNISPYRITMYQVDSDNVYTDQESRTPLVYSGGPASRSYTGVYISPSIQDSTQLSFQIMATHYYLFYNALEALSCITLKVLPIRRFLLIPRDNSVYSLCLQFSQGPLFNLAKSSPGQERNHPACLIVGVISLQAFSRLLAAWQMFCSVDQTLHISTHQSTVHFAIVALLSM